MKRILQYGMTTNYGGIEAFIMNIYRNIDRNKVQFDFIVNTNEKISYENEIESLGGRIIRQKYFSRKRYPFRHYVELYQYFKQNKDLVAVHINKANIRDIDLLILAAIFKVPVRIIHSHTSNGNKMKFLEKLNKKIIKWTATHFFACSDEAGKYMFGDDYTVIKNGIDIEKYSFNKEIRKEIRCRYHIKDDDFIIGSIGRFSKEKNTLFILEVFVEVHKNISNSKLLLIGNGPLLEEIKIKIKNEKIEDSVIVLGEVDDVYRFYSAMDLFLLPSMYEGFGMVLLEAQVSGLKCLASKDRIPSLVNVTNRVEFILLEEGRKLWADKAIEYVKYERNSEIKSIVNAGFDSKDIARKLKDVYLEGRAYG